MILSTSVKTSQSLASRAGIGVAIQILHKPESCFMADQCKNPGKTGVFVIQ
jgi:hypothetical protein